MIPLTTTCTRKSNCGKHGGPPTGAWVWLDPPDHLVSSTHYITLDGMGSKSSVDVKFLICSWTVYPSPSRYMQWNVLAKSIINWIVLWERIEFVAPYVLAFFHSCLINSFTSSRATSSETPSFIMYNWTDFGMSPLFCSFCLTSTWIQWIQLNVTKSCLHYDIRNTKNHSIFQSILQP